MYSSQLFKQYLSNSTDSIFAVPRDQIDLHNSWSYSQTHNDLDHGWSMVNATRTRTCYTTHIEGEINISEQTFQSNAFHQQTYKLYPPIDFAIDYSDNTAFLIAESSESRNRTSLHYDDTDVELEGLLGLHPIYHPSLETSPLSERVYEVYESERELDPEQNIDDLLYPNALIKREPDMSTGEICKEIESLKSKVQEINKYVSDQHQNRNLMDELDMNIPNIDIQIQQTYKLIQNFNTLNINHFTEQDINILHRVIELNMRKIPDLTIIEEHKNLRVFYRRMHICLEELLVSHKSISSTLIDPNISKAKMVSGFYNILGMIPVVGILGKIAGGITISQGFDKAVASSKAFSSLGTMEEQLSFAEEIARRITIFYKDQILSLMTAEEVEELKARKEHIRKLNESDSYFNIIRDGVKKTVTIESNSPCIEAAEYAVLRILNGIQENIIVHDGDYMGADIYDDIINQVIGYLELPMDKIDFAQDKIIRKLGGRRVFNSDGELGLLREFFLKEGIFSIDSPIRDNEDNYASAKITKNFCTSIISKEREFDISNIEKRLEKQEHLLNENKKLVLKLQNSVKPQYNGAMAMMVRPDTNNSNLGGDDLSTIQHEIKEIAPQVELLSQHLAQVEDRLDIIDTESSMNIVKVQNISRSISVDLTESTSFAALKLQVYKRMNKYIDISEQRKTSLWSSGNTPAREEKIKIALDVLNNVDSCETIIELLNILERALEKNNMGTPSGKLQTLLKILVRSVSRATN
eukprot:TRINITY_DN8925_c0_g1_i1.p2 TRINITY_DN8925_c0_g1~~TRINITY_DN8925_c0_g1_i1.p2  ORF type:complete len:761 (+),score=159.30 TRINITY_DN8925_c0_g1_i1:25-2283(+)